jgi:hypothetical protein
MNVIMTVCQSVDNTKTVDIGKFKLYCYETIVNILQNLPWVYISPTVHSMLFHNWELFSMNSGKPIAILSESGLESWHKKTKGWRQGIGCRARQDSHEHNICDIIKRQLIISSPIMAKEKELLYKTRKTVKSVPPSSIDDALIQELYVSE